MNSVSPPPSGAVFISHRIADVDLATHLAQELRESGFTVWLDEWEINIGDSIVQKMQEGLEGTAFLVLCYSDRGVLAPWISREWMSALARQLQGHDVKVLPVRLSGGEPPAILSDIKYADLVRDWKKGVGDLLRAMGKGK